MSTMNQREDTPFYSEPEVDKITDLPGHIIDKILTRVPLHDAVRTSILSTKWRYKWVTLPSLVFDKNAVLISTNDPILKTNKLVGIIDRVLLLHSGPIHLFKLSHQDLEAVCDIDRWILFLSRGSVKEFVLEIWHKNQSRYKLPSSIYSCQKLIRLELFNCFLKLPGAFKGFQNLKSLALQGITMDQAACEHMVSSCPLLERLILWNIDGFSDLKITAPNLLFFYFDGVFENVSFEETFHLTTIWIELSAKPNKEVNSGNLVKVFACLSRIRKLHVMGFSLMYLAAGTIPRNLPTPCVDLSFLSICINFNDMDENLTALCLLRSSPNLQELELMARPEEQQADAVNFTNIMGNFLDYRCDQLKLVKVVGISGSKQELNFINFVLAKSPLLERMSVKPASVDVGSELVKELLRFKRASHHAEIVYLDP